MHRTLHLRPTFFHPLDLGRPILNEPPPSPALPPRPPHTLSPTNYGTTTAPCIWTNEIKIKTTVLLFDLAHKQYDGIIKGWLHCLTPESIRRLLVSNIIVRNQVPAPFLRHSPLNQACPPFQNLCFLSPLFCSIPF